MLDLAVTPGGQLSWKRKEYQCKIHDTRVLFTAWQDPVSCRHCPEKFFPLGTFQGCNFSGAPTTSSNHFLAVEFNSIQQGKLPKGNLNSAFFSVLFQLFEYLVLTSSPKFRVVMKI